MPLTRFLSFRCGLHRSVIFRPAGHSSTSTWLRPSTFTRPLMIRCCAVFPIAAAIVAAMPCTLPKLDLCNLGVVQEDPRVPVAATRQYSPEARPRARTHGAIVAVAPLDGFSSPVSSYVVSIQDYLPTSVAQLSIPP